MSRWMFADGSLGISETPEILQKQTKKALRYTRKLRVTANVKEVRSSVCNEDKMDPVSFSWKREKMNYRS